MFGIEGISKLKHPDIRILIAEVFGGLRGMREFLPGSGMAHLLTVRDDVRVLGMERNSKKPVIVSSKIGGGEAYYFGTNMFGASLHAYIGWKWHVFFREIIDKTRYTSKFALEDSGSQIAVKNYSPLDDLNIILFCSFNESSVGCSYED